MDLTPVMDLNTILAPLTQLGPPGAIIGFLLWALVRKDKQVEQLQEARVVDQVARAAEALRVAKAVEVLNAGAIAREETTAGRIRIMEATSQAVQSTAKAVDAVTVEMVRIGRIVDANSLRLENIDKNTDAAVRK